MDRIMTTKGKTASKPFLTVTKPLCAALLAVLLLFALTQLTAYAATNTTPNDGTAPDGAAPPGHVEELPLLILLLALILAIRIIMHILAAIRKWNKRGRREKANMEAEIYG